jgi:hypothetical protein
MAMIPPQPIAQPGMSPGYGPQITPSSPWQQYMTPSMDQGLVDQSTTMNDAQLNSNEESAATSAVTNYESANSTQAQIAGAMLTAQKQADEFAEAVAASGVSTTKSWINLASSA